MRYRVLVVEDDLIQSALSSAILAQDDISVTCVDDGRKAEYEVRSHPPDLILLDVNIPHRNGFEICRELKSRPETRLIPVVLLTGLAETGDRIHGIEAGADDFLTKPIDPIEFRARIRSLLKRKEYTDELEQAEHVLMALGATIEAKDPYTKGHCDRLSALSLRFGRELKLSADELRALDIAGALHDIGKVVIPDAILLKAGPLNADEWSIMRQHPEVGERICRPLRSIQLVLPIIRHHHERHNGSGYPDRLSGTEIPLLASVMQLVDVYDALTTDRPYRSALSASKALKQMSAEVDKGWWHADLFRIFSALIHEEIFQWQKPSMLDVPQRISA